jgi:hypothetical protein
MDDTTIARTIHVIAVVLWIGSLFRRGDHDVAVFQAFKEVEVAVRHAANAKGAGYADSEVGTTLMRKAFHPETGPLADKTLVVAEREAEMQQNDFYRGQRLG